MARPKGFWDRVDRSRGIDGCWPWLGPLQSMSGYGTFTDECGWRHPAHRKAWELHNGQIVAADLCVCHSCDFPPCVNPAHLWVGTHSDNKRDFDAKHMNEVRALVRYPTTVYGWRHLDPQIIKDAKAHVAQHGFWKRYEDAVKRPVLRDGIWHYAICASNPTGTPQDPSRCSAMICSQNVWASPGVFVQCSNPKQRSGMCTQHWRMRQADGLPDDGSIYVSDHIGRQRSKQMTEANPREGNLA